jgi:hypothetical protein
MMETKGFFTTSGYPWYSRNPLRERANKNNSSFSGFTPGQWDFMAAMSKNEVFDNT